MEVFKVGMEKQRVLEQQNKHSWTFFNAKLNLCCNPPGLFVALLPFSALIKTFVLGAKCY